MNRNILFYLLLICLVDYTSAAAQVLVNGDFKTDTSFTKGSGISSIAINPQQIKNLTMLGQVWGFVKYHHPMVAKGEVDMDNALFKVMPTVIAANDDAHLSNALEKWVDGFGVPPVCNNCIVKNKERDIQQKPDYGMIFNHKILSESLTGKLTYILNNRNTGSHYYIGTTPNVNNPIFKNEKAYRNFPYPDAGYRLLCLYRYWNIIQYFWPDKYLIGEDWNKVLPDCIPGFTQAANEKEYALNTLALIARIHDTHANIFSGVKALSDFRGKFGVPIQAKFIEDKLVITGYYKDTLNIKQLVKIGDVIESINGEPVDELMKKYLPYTAASNYSTQLRDMPRTYLLRANNADFKLGLVHNSEKQNVVVTGIPIPQLNYGIDGNPDPKSPGYYLLDNNIGYIFPGRYKNADLLEIKKMFAGTKGIIVDMRCYPSEFMPFTFVPYIKTGNPDFVKFTSINVNNPGMITFGKNTSNAANHEYNGKVVVIVNEVTQSQAEYTTMALQSSSNVTVIGSTTAGADGDVSAIVLPGNINTYISGLGVYYPDGTQTQRTGVKIDEVIKPTIAGIKAGKDELLDRAKALILN